MALTVFNRLYRRLGRSYPVVFLTLELQSAFVITAATLGLFSFYYNASADDYLRILVGLMILVAVAVGITLARTLPLMRPIQEWIAGARDEEQTEKAWAAGVYLPLELIRRDLAIPILVAIVPGAIWAVIVLQLSWLAFFPLFAGSLVALGYSAILHYLVLEAGMRPVLVDINQFQAAPRLSAEVSAIPLRVRLMAALPLINLITGLVVAAFTSGGGGGAALGVDVLVAVAVATTISLELTVLFAKSILRPIADLQRATEAVREGHFDVSVPVTTGDELGELAASFNQMVQGLAEREQLREAFGTYLDKSVAEYILSEGFAEEGVERDVSVLVCDVRDFTEFARQAEAKEVVARLNELFEIVVPIVTRHGGHIDKFVGDGVLAVFGVPETYPDHADRAVRAACEIATRVNSDHGPRPEDRRGGEHGPGGGRLDRRRGTAQLQRHRRRGQRRGAGRGGDPRDRRGHPDHRGHEARAELLDRDQGVRRARAEGARPAAGALCAADGRAGAGAGRRGAAAGPPGRRAEG